MTRFKTEKEFEDFCDNSTICLCGKLMTGLHMMHCNRVRVQRERLAKMNVVTDLIEAVKKK